MTIKLWTLVLTTILLACSQVRAQVYTQNLRGQVIEKNIQKPILGAIIQIEGTSLGAVSDLDGNFTIEHIPIGRHQVKCTAMGFKEMIVPNILIQSGKEIVITLAMEEKIFEGKNIVIKGESKKNKPLNEMSLVSARTFTVEEAQKYAAAVNDPARMATNFAGVVAADDGNNHIVIRGNSPNGLLWRMEGIDVPNPNHFANTGASGGGISILSAQLLANSDFVTGAFAAEYGNALSGVFDLKLRKGNNQEREYTVQAGVLGLNVAAEGPFSKKYQGSYLINYRYSTLSVLDKMGLHVTGRGNSTNFQDLSYNIYLPTKKFGQFSLFSFGGLSDQHFAELKDSSKWITNFDRFGNVFHANVGLWAATHQIHLNERILLKSGIGYSIASNKYLENYVLNDYSLRNTFNEKYITKKITGTSTLNYKYNSRLLIRSGIILNHYQFRFNQAYREIPAAPLVEVLDVYESTQSGQVFSQAQYKFTDKLLFSVGLHGLYLTLNKHYSIEPRASIQYQVNPKNILTAGFGKHSQMQGFGIYFAEQTTSSGGIYRPNENLDFSKALHYVVGYQHQFSRQLRFKTEAYYQSLYNLPISTDPQSSFSVVNVMDNYMRDPLINKGKGKNYGVEITLEKNLHKNYYYLLTTSLYNSLYKAANGREYNTRFNGGFAANAVFGKDFISSNQRRTIGLNVKGVYAGGYRTTPINTAQSVQEERTIYYEDKAYQEQLPNYFRGDIRLSITWNRKRMTSTLSLDVQNVTNRKNVAGRIYDAKTQTVKTYFQAPIIPILNYKIEF